MTQTASSRLISLILLLQRRPNQKAAELAGTLGVSVRTLHRYLEMLDEMGIPVCSERGPYGGFSLARGYKMPPLVFTAQEAAALALGAGMVEQVWGSLYRDAALAALAKLESVLPDEQRQEVAWARRSLVSSGLHRADLRGIESHLEILRSAVRDRHQMRISYRGVGAGQPSSRLLDPYALVYRWGWWYVAGYCHLRQDVRTFRLDRLLELETTGLVFPPPAGFDIHTYLAAEFKPSSPVVARLRWPPAYASVAYDNRLLWDKLEELPDGSLLTVFTSPDLTWAASSVLAYGPAVVVLDPPELRALVREWAQWIAAQYNNE